MKPHSCLRSCAVAILLILLLHITAGAVSRSAPLAALMIYAQTGKVVSSRPVPEETENCIVPTIQITQPTRPAEEAPEAVFSFSAEDLSLIGIRYQADIRPDAAQLLLSSFTPSLGEASPAVLIVHTHTTESYADVYDRVNFRTLDEQKNMLAIGDAVARVLEMGGITVIHDRTVHDYPDYNTAYSAARRTIQGYLARYPDICIVLDLHRDASADETSPMVTAATVGGQSAAQLMMVVGCGTESDPIPNWQENFALALKLAVLLEQENPGITRPMAVCPKRYNLDLSPGSLLVEVGAAGNTLQEALIAGDALGRAILALADMQ